MVLNAHAGTKYGVSFPVLCRARFGTKGANIPAILRAIVACGWFGIQTWIGGTAIDAFLTAVWSGWARLDGMIARKSAAYMDLVFNFLDDSGFDHSEGNRGDQTSRNLVGAVVAFWRFGFAFLGEFECGRTRKCFVKRPAFKNHQANFWTIFPGALTASVGYWATLSLNIPDFTRYAKSQKSQMLGQALGLPLTMTAFAFIGVAVTIGDGNNLR